LVPLSLVFFQAFGVFSPYVGLTGEISLKYWADFFENESISLQDSLSYSLYVASVATVITFVLSIVLVILENFVNLPGKKALSGLYQIPLAVPSLVGGYMASYMLMPGGVVNAFLVDVGLLKEPVMLIYDKLGFGVILTLTWLWIPVMTLMVNSGVQRIDPSLLDACKVAGANLSQAVIHVVMPLVVPQLLSSVLVIFVIYFNALEVPLVVGALYPKMQQLEMFYLVYKNVFSLNLTVGSIFAIIILAISMVILFIYNWVSRWSDRWRARLRV